MGVRRFSLPRCLSLLRSRRPVFAGNDTAVLIGQSLQLNAVDVDNSGFTFYQWSPPMGLNDPSIRNPVAQITGNITYFVTATTADGCVGTDSIVI